MVWLAHFTTCFCWCAHIVLSLIINFVVVALSLIYKLLPRNALTKCLWPYCQERLDKQKLLPRGWNVPFPVLSLQVGAFYPNKNWTWCKWDPELVWKETLQRWRTLHMKSVAVPLHPLRPLTWQRGSFQKNPNKQMTASNCGLRKQADSNHVQQQLNSCQALTKEKKGKHWSGIL